MANLSTKKVDISRIKNLFRKFLNTILLNNIIFVIFSLFVSVAIIGVLVYLDYNKKLEESKNEFYLPKFIFKKQSSMDFIKKEWGRREQELLKIDEFNQKNIFK